MFKISTEHEHSYDITGAKESRVGLVGGRHTVLMVLECKCGHKMAFPDDNFRLALREGTEETLELLADIGLSMYTEVDI